MKLNKEFFYLRSIPKFFHLIREEGDIFTETMEVAGYFVEC
jgi:hypothetical protein